MSKDEIEFYKVKIENLVNASHLKEISIDTFGILPIVTPGHTEGGTCYLIDGDLFSGDTVFKEDLGGANKDT